MSEINKNGKVISLRINMDYLKTLTKKREETGISVTFSVNEAIKDYLINHKLIEK